MIKVLHCISDSNIGGAGAVLLTCLRNLNPLEFESVVLLPEGSLLTSEAELAGARTIGYGSAPDRSFSVGAVIEIIKIIRKEKPDIVHANGLLSARAAAFLCGVKVRLFTRHSVFELKPGEKAFPRKQLAGLVNNTLSTGIIAVSPAVKQMLTETGTKAKKITVILNGPTGLRTPPQEERAALRERLEIREGDFVILMSARLVPVKGHAYAVAAMQRLAARQISAKLVIIGTGEAEKELMAQAKRQAPENVIFCGFAKDVAPYVSISDVTLNCSYGTETTSMAISEAMSLGVPAVASDFGGNPFMVEDGENGLITPQKDPEAVAAAIERLYFDRALLAELGGNARRKFETVYNAKAMTRELETLYREQLEKCR